MFHVDPPPPSSKERQVLTSKDKVTVMKGSLVETVAMVTVLTAVRWVWFESTSTKIIVFQYYIMISVLTLNVLAWDRKGPRLQKRVYLGNGWREIFEKNMYGSQIILANFFTSGVFW